MSRCGKCENCKKLERVKTSVLRCCGTPKVTRNTAARKSRALTEQDFNHADDGVVQVWNDQLKNLPCTGDPNVVAQTV